jgi:hypothetical protein
VKGSVPKVQAVNKTTAEVDWHDIWRRAEAGEPVGNTTGKFGLMAEVKAATHPEKFMSSHDKWFDYLLGLAPKLMPSEYDQADFISLDLLPEDVRQWFIDAKQGVVTSALVMVGPKDMFKSGFIGAHFLNRARVADMGDLRDFDADRNDCLHFSEKSFVRWPTGVILSQLLGGFKPVEKVTVKGPENDKVLYAKRGARLPGGFPRIFDVNFSELFGTNEKDALFPEETSKGATQKRLTIWNLHTEEFGGVEPFLTPLALCQQCRTPTAFKDMYERKCKKCVSDTTRFISFFTGTSPGSVEPLGKGDRRYHSEAVAKDPLLKRTMCEIESDRKKTRAASAGSSRLMMMDDPDHIEDTQS